jgi:hypothetical protein
VGGQLSTAGRERVGDETGLVDPMVPHHDDAHGPAPSAADEAGVSNSILEEPTIGILS